VDEIARLERGQALPQGGRLPLSLIVVMGRGVRLRRVPASCPLVALRIHGPHVHSLSMG